jgi:RNA polymerase sigma-70 factor, ECF subfamily
MSGTLPLPDADAVARVQTMFVLHTPALRGFILSLLPDFSTVDDVLQETFLTVTAKAAEYEPGSSFLRWSCAIARFKLLEFARQNSRAPQPLSPAVVESLCASEPDNEGDAGVQLAALAECMTHLAPQARRAVELRYQHAHKPAEIARLMGWSVEAVYVALSRARATLRDCVSQRMRRFGS